MVGRLQMATTDPIAIEVKSREAAAATPKTVGGPLDERFLVMPNEANDPLVALSAMAWLIAILVVGYLIRGELRRSALAKRPGANEFLAGLERDVDGTLLKYLRQRFAVKTQEPTAGDIERVLKRAGVAEGVRRRWNEWQRSRDSRRFAPIPGGTRGGVSVVEARELILEAEAEACKRS